MRLLVSGTTRTMGGLSAWRRRLGWLTSPAAGNSLQAMAESGLPWAMDNGAFSGFDPAAYRRMLARAAGLPGCLFAVVPDVVANARETLALFKEWAGQVREAGFPLALVGQDGAERERIPWGEFDAWFIGGSTGWKLSLASADLAAEAKARGKWVHMGRVNSLTRLRTAHSFGCDSVDGTSMSRFGSTYIVRFCRWLDSLDAQPSLF